METRGIVIALIDVPGEHTRDYNLWYDLDHLPEFAALPGMVLGRRYIAPPEYRALRPPSPLPELAEGRGAYCTTYLIADDDLDAVQKRWSELGDALRAQRRIFRHGKIADVGFYRTVHLAVRDDVPAAAHAAPHLGHTGILVVLTEVADPAQRDGVDAWFREVHAPDLLGVQGVTAAMRFARADGSGGRHANVYLLEGDPTETARDLERQRPGLLERGRVPAPGGASQILFQGVFRSVQPMRYDFRVD